MQMKGAIGFERSKDRTARKLSRPLQPLPACHGQRAGICVLVGAGDASGFPLLGLQRDAFQSERKNLPAVLHFLGIFRCSVD